MKRILISLLAVMCVGLLGVVVLVDKKPPQVSEEVLATVNGSVLTREEAGNEALAREDVGGELPSQENIQAWTCDLEVELVGFLNAGTAEEKAATASRIIQSIMVQADNGRVEADLAEATGALLGAAGEAAPEVADAIVKASGADYADLVVSAIAVAATATGDPEAVRAAAMAGGSEKPIDGKMQEKVLSAAKGFKLIQDNWDPVQGQLQRDIFADQDGGEPSCPRGTKER